MAILEITDQFGAASESAIQASAEHLENAPLIEYAPLTNSFDWQARNLFLLAPPNHEFTEQLIGLLRRLLVRKWL